MKKYIIAFIIFIISLTSFAVYANDFSATQNTKTKNVYIEGLLDDTSSGGDITLLLTEQNGNIAYFNQITPQKDGKYIHKFKYVGDASQCILKVLYNGVEVNDTLISAVAEKAIISGDVKILNENDTYQTLNNDLSDMPIYSREYEIGGVKYSHTYIPTVEKVNSSKAKFVAEINNIYADVNTKLIGILAYYDENNMLKGIKNSEFTAQYGENGQKQLINGDVSEIPENTSRIRAFLWNGLIDIMPYAKSKENVSDNITVYCVGDSTCAEYSDGHSYPQAGWGSVIGGYFKEDCVNVVNTGSCGATATSFVEETNGKWSDTSKNVQPGDYVIFSLGINDSASAEAYTLFKENMQLMIDDAVQKGANIILCPQIHCAWQMEDTQRTKNILQTVKELAEENGVTYIDWYSAAQKHYESIGMDDVRKNYFMDIDTIKNDFGLTNTEILNHKNQEIKINNSDYTHLSVRGANYYANLFINLLSAEACDLKYYINTVQ